MNLPLLGCLQITRRLNRCWWRSARHSDIECICLVITSSRSDQDFIVSRVLLECVNNHVSHGSSIVNQVHIVSVVRVRRICRLCSVSICLYKCCGLNFAPHGLRGTNIHGVARKDGWLLRKSWCVRHKVIVVRVWLSYRDIGVAALDCQCHFMALECKSRHTLWSSCTLHADIPSTNSGCWPFGNEV